MTTDIDIIIALARKLEAENTRLRAENAALREALPHMTLTSEEMGMPSLKYQEIKPTTPRTITADELREGQVVVIHDEERNDVVGGLVSRAENGGGIMRFKGHGETIFGLDRSEVDTIVLLEDAPPRLTVHALNTAPVGSWISRGMESNARRKDADGKWHRAWMFEGQHPESSEELIANGWADATIAYPEATP